LRVNANGITGGGSGFQSVLAQISVNNVPVSVTNPTVTVGYIQSELCGFVPQRLQQRRSDDRQ
jgi:hypothetical protein